LDKPGHYYIENIFLGCSGRIRPVGSKGFSVSKKTIFEIDLPDKTGFQKQNMVFFGRKYPLPIESDFFGKPVMLFQGYITLSPCLIR